MIGSSAGRSRGNPTAPGAVQRGTPRERAAIDPPRVLRVPLGEPKKLSRGEVFATTGIALLGGILGGSAATLVLSWLTR